METKKEIRNYMTRLKQEQSAADVCNKSRQICQRILAFESYEKAHTILAYMAMEKEVDLDVLFQNAWQAGKHIAVPKCLPSSHEMDFGEITSYDDVETGFYGIREPNGTCRLLDLDALHCKADNVLILMPGIAFDRFCNRIGYGGGYYDRFLQRYPQFPTLAPTFDFQIFERELPIDPTDQKPDQIVTEFRTVQQEYKKSADYEKRRED